MIVHRRTLPRTPWIEVEVEQEGGKWVVYRYDTRTKDLDWDEFESREDAVKAYKAAK